MSEGEEERSLVRACGVEELRGAVYVGENQEPGEVVFVGFDAALEDFEAVEFRASAPQMAAVAVRRFSAISRALPAVSSRSTTFKAGRLLRNSPHCMSAMGWEWTSRISSRDCPGSAAMTCEMRSFCSPTIRARLRWRSSWLGSRLPAMGIFDGGNSQQGGVCGHPVEEEIETRTGSTSI